MSILSGIASGISGAIDSAVGGGGGGGGGILIDDAFTDTNGTALTSHTVTDVDTVGGGWKSYDAFGAMEIQTDAATSTALGTQTANAIDCGQASFTISAIGYTVSSSGGSKQVRVGKTAAANDNDTIYMRINGNSNIDLRDRDWETTLARNQ